MDIAAEDINLYYSIEKIIDKLDKDFFIEIDDDAHSYLFSYLWVITKLELGIKEF